MKQRFFFGRALLPQGWVKNVGMEVDGGLIRSLTVGCSRDPGDSYGALAIPGLPNLHSHAFQRAMAGLTERRGPNNADDFWSWRDVMYRFVGYMDPDDIAAIAAYAYADMLEAGFTSVGEFHYVHRTPEGGLYDDPAELACRHIQAAETTGIALTLLPVFYAASNFGGVAPSTQQRRFINDLETYAKIHERTRKVPGVITGVAPHSLRAVTPAQLAVLTDLSPDTPLHIHIAEQVKEVEDCKAWSGLRPVEWLFQNANVDQRWCLVHATHITEEETKALAGSKAVAGLCPITEANLGDGIFPARDFLSAGGCFGVGSDSNVQIDAAGELRLLEYSQRLSGRVRNALADLDQASTGTRLFEKALVGGAQALGRRVGAIAEGFRADILVLDDTHPDLAGKDDDAVLDTWVFGGGRALIDTVIAGGKVTVEKGRHIAREKINQQYRDRITKLLDHTR